MMRITTSSHDRLTISISIIVHRNVHSVCKLRHEPSRNSGFAASTRPPNADDQRLLGIDERGQVEACVGVNVRAGGRRKRRLGLAFDPAGGVVLGGSGVVVRRRAHERR